MKDGQDLERKVERKNKENKKFKQFNAFCHTTFVNLRRRRARA